jgi:dolichyl-diphosphooligosaccharide--protein glycosyltransferase
MDKKKTTLTVLKSVAIIVILVSFVFLLRAEAYDLSAIPVEQRSTFIDSNGLPYFSEMDSYYNLRLTQNYLDHGSLGDTFLNKTPWDMHRYSPVGISADYTPFIVYVTSFLYYLANIIYGDMSVKEVAFWAGAIVASFVAIPAYIFVRRITNDYGGIAAAIIIALGANYFSHTFAGFFDTDMFTVTFPILTMLFFVESVRSNRLISRIIFIIATVLTLAIFSIAWQGYIFYPALLFIIVIVYLILGFYLKLNVIHPFSDYSSKLQWFINQKELFSVISIVLIGFVLLIIIQGIDNFLIQITALIGATSTQTTASAGSYPNVAVSIAELQIPTLLSGGIFGAFLGSGGGIINGVGGIVALFGAFIVIISYIKRLMDLKSIKSINIDKKLSKPERKPVIIQKFNKNKSSFDLFNDKFSSLNEVNKTKHDTFLYLIIFGVWIFISAIATTQGSRFIQILIMPIGLCAGVFVGYAADYIKNNVNTNIILLMLTMGSAILIAIPISQLGIPITDILQTGIPFLENWTNMAVVIFLIIVAVVGLVLYGLKDGSRNLKIKQMLVVIVITLAVISPSIVSAYQISYATVPGTSDPMWDSMTFIDKNATNNTVIASWWDFGYVFEIAADRQTVFDGGAQTGMRAYWIGRSISTTNDTLSAGILEMLATTGDNASNVLENYTNDSGVTTEILLKTLGVPKSDAINVMTNDYNLTQVQANNVTKYSHPDNPRPVVFVMSSDMIQKAFWWSYFGNWDFEIGNSTGYQYMASTVPDQMKMSKGKGQANVVNLEQNGVSFITAITKGSGNNTTNATVKAVFTENNSVVKDQNGSVYQPFSVNKMIIIEDGYLMKNETVNKSGDYTLLVMGYGGSYSSILMTKELENSMFTKLYILGGFGQSAFELINQEPGVSLWRVVRNNSTNTTG